jgi:hypothetical protein
MTSRRNDFDGGPVIVEADIFLVRMHNCGRAEPEYYGLAEKRPTLSEPMECLIETDRFTVRRWAEASSI